MKTVVTYPIILLFCIVNILSLQTTFSQNKETKKLLSEIEGKWQKDDNGNITYTKVIENINQPKDSIYNRALAYFTYSYNDGGSLIQDKAKGLIVQKGIYENTFHRISPAPAIIPLMEELVNTHYELRIEIKDNGAQILLTLIDYYCLTAAGMNSSTNKEYSVSSSFPVNPEGNKKNKFGRAFFESHQKGQQSFVEIEKALRKGYTVEDYKIRLNDQEFKKYYGNGNIKMIGFKNKNGNITGEWKLYYKNGQLWLIGNAENGLANGERKEYFENGALKSIGNFFNAEKTGEWKEYFENGALKSNGNFFNGGKTGEWKAYYDNGQLNEIGDYSKHDSFIIYDLRKEKKTGEWKYYDETGKLIKTENHN